MVVYPHQGMLLQNLHRHYLYKVIRLPKLKDLEQGIPTFPNCDNYGIQRLSNPNPTSVMMFSLMTMHCINNYILVLKLIT